ncbi:phage tail protein [Pseudomonas putida]|uniref:phage tail assembly chaperone n=1 Tax=Pseudomonas putida TaxID=303 RepID=UPI001059C80A|nr:phage tail assembly chaperone [Pseudomonas putida]TDJ76969.1 phage tail protein [Pseudomonas putida]
MLYSATTGCCYIPGLNIEVPTDAKEITQERFLAVIAEPEPGKVRSHDEEGLPILIDPPVIALTSEQLAANERAWRDAEVSSTEWLVTRHRDEQDMQLATTLTAEQFAELLVYRQALRDWPQTEAFPDSAQRPVAPAWIAEQVL